MIHKDKVTEAIRSMTKNPDWRDVIRYAPGLAAHRIALAFYASKNLSSMDQKEKDEYREFRELLERQLNAKELKYLAEAFARMGVDAARDHYNELFSKKSPDEQAQGQKEYDELADKMREEIVQSDKDGGKDGEEVAPNAREGASGASEGGDGDDEPAEGENAPEDEESGDSDEEGEEEDEDEGGGEDDEQPQPAGDDAGEGEPSEGAEDSASGVFGVALDGVFAGYPGVEDAEDAEPTAEGTPAPEAAAGQAASAPFQVPQQIIDRDKAKMLEVVKGNVGILKNGFRFKKRAGGSAAPKKEDGKEQTAE